MLNLVSLCEGSDVFSTGFAKFFAAVAAVEYVAENSRGLRDRVYVRHFLDVNRYDFVLVVMCLITEPGHMQLIIENAQKHSTMLEFVPMLQKRHRILSQLTEDYERERLLPSNADQGKQEMLRQTLNMNLWRVRIGHRPHHKVLTVASMFSSDPATLISNYVTGCALELHDKLKRREAAKHAHLICKTVKLIVESLLKVEPTVIVSRESVVQAGIDAMIEIMPPPPAGECVYCGKRRSAKCAAEEAEWRRTLSLWRATRVI